MPSVKLCFNGETRILSGALYSKYFNNIFIATHDAWTNAHVSPGLYANTNTSLPRVVERLVCLSDHGSVRLVGVLVHLITGTTSSRGFFSLDPDGHSTR